MAKKNDIANKMTVPSKPMPSLSLSEDSLPAIKSWEVGRKYQLVVNAELVNLSKGEYYSEDSERNKRYDARFKIISVKEK